MYGPWNPEIHPSLISLIWVSYLKCKNIDDFSGEKLTGLSPVLPDLKTHTLRIVENIDGTLGVEDTTIVTSRASGIYSSEQGKLRCTSLWDHTNRLQWYRSSTLIYSGRT